MLVIYSTETNIQRACLRIFQRLATSAAYIVGATAIVRIWMPNTDTVKHLCNTSLPSVAKGPQDLGGQCFTYTCVSYTAPLHEWCSFFFSFFSKCCIKCCMTAASCKHIPKHSSHLELHVLPDIGAALTCRNTTRSVAPSMQCK